MPIAINDQVYRTGRNSISGTYRERLAFQSCTPVVEGGAYVGEPYVGDAYVGDESTITLTDRCYRRRFDFEAITEQALS